MEPRGLRRWRRPGPGERPRADGAAPGCPLRYTGEEDLQGPAGLEVRREPWGALGPRSTRGIPQTEGAAPPDPREGPCADEAVPGCALSDIGGEDPRSPAGLGVHREPWRVPVLCSGRGTPQTREAMLPRPKKRGPALVGPTLGAHLETPWRGSAEPR
ncbi:hypothetical protein NDU88_007358 [Pleurodeles waltl]|uniref:Uncharacterized protein n=1 Tax=Pleurodeles waltl TaxID=8319 RepID=A0AAV7NT23_PLEWA|nr:hypothetical protein NDU88_007358 [Pleurodeles waltl]